MRRLPDALLNTLAAALIGAVIFLAFGHAFLNYDTFYTLAWGDQAVRGEVPDYDVPVAPTPHPLATAVGAVVSPLGDSAEDVLLALGLLALGFLAVGLFRLGKDLYAWPVGLLAAAILMTRVPILNFGIRGYVDLPAIAFIVWAAVLEARRSRRGAPVLVLLALAGLLRPEAWLYAGVYWVWWAWGQPDWRARLKLLPLAVAAPLLWALTDLIVTGDPLWSFTGTRDLAAELGRETGLDSVPSVMPRRLGEILRAPELVASVIGFAAGLWYLRDRTLLPAAVAVLNGVAYLVLAAGGLSLLGRYLFLAGAMLALFAALAALGWTALPALHRARRAWQIGGAVVLVAFAVFIPSQIDRLDALRDDIAARDRVQADLLDLVRTPRAAAAIERCGTIYVPNHRPVPELAFWTERSPADVVSAQLRRPGARGVYIEPVSEEVKALSILDPKDPERFDARPPPGYTVVAANRSWRFLSGPCG